jgi:hypothetical protein
MQISSGVPVEFAHRRRCSPATLGPRDDTARNCTSLPATISVTTTGSSAETLGVDAGQVNTVVTTSW